MGYLYILGTIIFTVYGQIVVKWQVGLAGPIPVDFTEKTLFLIRLVLRPWVLSSLTAGFVAFLCWVGALSKFQLSYAYPFMSLSFVLVLFLSGLFFREPVTMVKIFGICLIVLGIVLGSR
jgi:multidrug transporter EmrE-like cation transporter